jgi:tRNA-specific 2-thiouridylase
MNKENNTITVGKKEDLAINYVIANNLNMFVDEKKISCDVKLRFRSTTVKCDLLIKDNTVFLTLKEPVYGVATGQTAVFYDKDKVIGSGWIEKTEFKK